MIFENIEKLCKQNNVSIFALEKACGFGNATIRGWKSSDPSVGKVKKVAEYFGVTVNDIIKEERET